VKRSEDRQKEQKPARRDDRGAEPPCQKSGTVGQCHVAWLCHPGTWHGRASSLFTRSLDFSIWPSFGVFIRGSLGVLSGDF